eukprot:6081867-Prymnesium_polylepis.1
MAAAALGALRRSRWTNSVAGRPGSRATDKATQARTSRPGAMASLPPRWSCPGWAGHPDGRRPWWWRPRP